MTTGNNRKPGLRWLAAEILADPRLALMLALGFSAGLPFLLVFSTLSAWLREAEFIDVRHVPLVGPNDLMVATRPSSTSTGASPKP